MLSTDQNCISQLLFWIWTTAAINFIEIDCSSERSQIRLELAVADKTKFAEMFKEAEQEKEEMIKKRLIKASNALKNSLKKATKNFRKSLVDSFIEFLERKYAKIASCQAGRTMFRITISSIFF